MNTKQFVVHTEQCNSFHVLHYIPKYCNFFLQAICNTRTHTSKQSICRSIQNI